MNLPIIVNVIRNPVSGKPDETFVSTNGASLEDLTPKSQGGLVVCRVNGGPDYVHRDDWSYVPQPGDLIEFIEYPKGDPITWLVIGLLAVAAFTVIRALKQPDLSEVDTANRVFNTNLSGNRAKPDSPIPKICGRMQYTPPFAATPYQEYVDNDQYYYAIFAVGVGNHTIEQDMIDDTPISHFNDVLVHKYLPPGTPPSSVNPSVVTAAEVSGQEMLTDKVVGPFTGCGPHFQGSKIGIDIVAPRGLGQQSGSSMASKSATFDVYFRPVDQFGAASASWALLATETVTAATTTPQRWSFLYDLPEACRPQVRLIRTDIKSESIQDAHEIQWDALRIYLSSPIATLNPNVAHYEVVMRASEQLNETTQRMITLIGIGHVRTLNAELQWQPEVESRNGAWWILELATSSVWGLGMPDGQIDLQSFYDIAQIAEERKDRFDYVFDATTDAWEAMQLIATSMRAKVFRRYGVLSIARDEAASLPITAFTPRNTAPHSMTMEQTMPTTDMPDGYVVEYLDYRTWLWTPIECPCPGVTSMSNPIRVRLQGITGYYHARREGAYLAAKLLYRRRNVHCVTEMHGMLPSYFAPVRWMPDVYGYGQAGDVISWDSTTRKMILSEVPNFVSGAAHYVRLQRDDGSLTSPISVTQGATDIEIVLMSDPDFHPVFDDGTREATKFMFGQLETMDELVRVTSVSDGGQTEEGAPLLNIEGEIDDDRVHTADAEWLGLDEPPISEADDPDNPDILPLASIRDLVIQDTRGYDSLALYRLENNGSAVYATTLSGGSIPGEWLTKPNPAVAGEYEAMASIVETFSYGDMYTGPALYGSSSPLDTWLPLDVTREWRLWGSIGHIVLNVQIRLKSTEVLQDSAIIELRNIPADSGD